MQEPLILISNDDGVRAEGIQALAISLSQFARVVVVAPSADQSATSHSITLRRPLRITKQAPFEGHRAPIDVYCVDGTPTDAVYMAVHQVLKGQKIDLVASGINHGANLGNDVLYSGTVSAAMEAAMLGIPAVAFSLVASHSFDFAPAARFAHELCYKLLGQTLPERLLLNVNFPKRISQEGFRVTTLGTHNYSTQVEKRSDPMGQAYYWLGGPWEGFENLPGTDCNAIHEGIISVTPLSFDLTAHHLMDFAKTLR